MKIKVNYDKTMSYKKLQAQVCQLIEEGTEEVVIFSMFDYDELGVNVTCPDLASTEPVIEGRCIFTIDYWRVSDEPVYSQEYTNPTWKDIINACNDMLLAGDRCGVYLETMRQKEERNGVKLIEFGIGS